MTALNKYIDDLVHGIDIEEDFPKTESSWEELFDLSKRLIAEIVILRRNATQQSITQTEQTFHTLKEVKDEYFPNRSLEELEGRECKEKK